MGQVSDRFAVMKSYRPVSPRILRDKPRRFSREPFPVHSRSRFGLDRERCGRAAADLLAPGKARSRGPCEDASLVQSSSFSGYLELPISHRNTHHVGLRERRREGAWTGGCVRAAPACRAPVGRHVACCLCVQEQESLSNSDVVTKYKAAAKIVNGEPG